MEYMPPFLGFHLGIFGPYSKGKGVEINILLTIYVALARSYPEA